MKTAHYLPRSTLPRRKSFFHSLILALIGLHVSQAFALVPSRRLHHLHVSQATVPLRASSEEKSARSEGLALALDDGTRKSHSVAENTQFVTGFFKGISTKSSFSQLVGSLYFVYDAMETAFNTTSDPSVKVLDYPELRRLESLEQDMVYYFGTGFKAAVRPSPATEQYVDRIKEISQTSPYLLVAHMYTRYLGDLFGGQVRCSEALQRGVAATRQGEGNPSPISATSILIHLFAPHLTLRLTPHLTPHFTQMMGGMARTSLKLDSGLGTRFYEFDKIKNTKAFIEGWYTKLNQLELTEAQEQAIVDEGNLVFAYNIDPVQRVGGREADGVQDCIENFQGRSQVQAPQQEV